MFFFGLQANNQEGSSVVSCVYCLALTGCDSSPPSKCAKAKVHTLPTWRRLCLWAVTKTNAHESDLLCYKRSGRIRLRHCGLHLLESCWLSQRFTLWRVTKLTTVPCVCTQHSVRCVKNSLNYMACLCRSLYLTWTLPCGYQSELCVFSQGATFLPIMFRATVMFVTSNTDSVISRHCE